MCDDLDQVYSRPPPDEPAVDLVEVLAHALRGEIADHPLTAEFAHLAPQRWIAKEANQIRRQRIFVANF